MYNKYFYIVNVCLCDHIDIYEIATTKNMPIACPQLVYHAFGFCCFFFALSPHTQIFVVFKLFSGVSDFVVMINKLWVGVSVLCCAVCTENPMWWFVHWILHSDIRSVERYFEHQLKFVGVVGAFSLFCLASLSLKDIWSVRSAMMNV